MKRCIICGRFLNKGVKLELCNKHRAKFYRNKRMLLYCYKTLIEYHNKYGNK